MQSLVPVHKQLLKFELVRFAVPCESAEHPWGKHNQAIVQGSLIQPNHKFDHNQNLILKVEKVSVSSTPHES